MRLNDGRTCEKCGRKTLAEGICLSCKSRVPRFTKGFSPFVYRGESASLVNRIKNGNPTLALYFAEKMAEYGIVGAKSSENMFIEAGLEAGIFSLLALLLMFLIRLRHRARYRLYVRSSDMQSIADVSSMIVASLFCFGSFSPLLSDHTAMYLFFTVFGMGSAALRSAKRQSDERVLYFEDETSSTSSVINVHIR